MKKLIAFFLGLFVSAAAFAADVTATMTVLFEGRTVYEVTNKFVGLTNEQAAGLQKTGLKQLDYASKHQDKGGPYTIVWKWNNDPAIETPGMKFGNVNAVLRQGVKWLDARVAAAEAKERAGLKKPWGAQ